MLTDEEMNDMAKAVQDSALVMSVTVTRALMDHAIAATSPEWVATLDAVTSDFVAKHEALMMAGAMRETLDGLPESV